MWLCRWSKLALVVRAKSNMKRIAENAISDIHQRATFEGSRAHRVQRLPPLHHHQFRRPPLRRQGSLVWRIEAARSRHHASLSTHSRQGMPLTVHLPDNLEVVVRQHHPAIVACEAAGMELLVHATTAARARASRLQVLPLDAAMAAVAQRAVRLVVVLLAVGLVADDVEVGGGEGLGARAAREAGFVPAACQAAVGGFHGLAFDDLAAASTRWFGYGAAARGWLGSGGFLWDWRRLGYGLW